MEFTENDVDNGKVRDSQDGHLFLKEARPSCASRNPPGISPLKTSFEGKHALSLAKILCSRNQFVDAFAVYESVLGKDSTNVEALIGQGICLQKLNLGSLAHEIFAEAARLEPQKSCALKRCGIVYKDEPQLVEAAEIESGRQYDVLDADEHTKTEGKVTSKKKKAVFHLVSLIQIQT